MFYINPQHVNHLNLDPNLNHISNIVNQFNGDSNILIFKTKEIFSKMAGLMMGPVNTSVIGTVMTLFIKF